MKACLSALCSARCQLVPAPKLHPNYASGRRLAAARELRGIKSVEDLAEFLDEPGYGVTTLRKMERGEIPMRDSHRLFIASRLGVSVSFFTARDVEALGDLDDESALRADRPEQFSRLSVALLLGQAKSATERLRAAMQTPLPAASEEAPRSARKHGTG